MPCLILALAAIDYHWSSTAMIGCSASQTETVWCFTALIRNNLRDDIKKMRGSGRFRVFYGMEITHPLIRLAQAAAFLGPVMVISRCIVILYVDLPR